ncbi:hypothetical protein DS2_10327 [Catenovulum agarivorans DS-2]|uniref:Uncharacterized protein n=1 Tax=Catenovulum agarivorans DS-2 TaxID=1328313 RepID=W7QAK0_9ALTE|nr:hypothetical protein [Catenovulum agarivorans]EWH09839.1 hypothetical protein DS2_10327 [Catenovulum agarivorans DS-2]
MASAICTPLTPNQSLQRKHYIAPSAQTQLNTEHTLLWRVTQQSIEQTPNFANLLATDEHIASLCKPYKAKLTRPANLLTLKLCWFFDSGSHFDALSLYVYAANLSNSLVTSKQDICEFVFVRERNDNGRTVISMSGGKHA